MRHILIPLFMVPIALNGQLVETSRPATPGAKPEAVCSRNQKVATLERAIFELTTSGVLQASSQLMRLCFGEPGNHFQLPVYFFIGAVDPAGTNGDKKALASLLNPLGGNANFAVVQDHVLWHATPDTPGGTYYSKFSFAYEVSAKYLTGNDTSGTNPARVGLVAGYGDMGIRYQTAVINLDDPSRVGLFWLQAKLVGATASADAVRRLFGQTVNSVIPAASFDGALDVPGLAIKVSGQKPLRTFRVTALKGWQTRIGFDFTPAKK